MRHIITLFLLTLIALAGCSVNMALKQPEKKDLAILADGTPRNLILAEFGEPSHTETLQGQRIDVFSFTQGYSDGARKSRAMLHGVADVLTLGLWEIVGTPTEATFDGENMVVEVRYNEHERVEKVTWLKRKES